MKFIYKTVLILLLYTNVYGQNIPNINITLTHKKPTLEKLLNELTTNPAINLSYNNEIIGNNPVLVFQKSTLSLQEILNEIVAQTPLEYQLYGKQIIIKRKSNILNQVVRGQIIDIDTQYPIEGANIRFEKIGLHTTSDKKGQFIFNKVPVGRHKIEVTHIGYDKYSEEIMIGSAKEVVLTIILNTASVVIDEVKITNGLNKSRPLNNMASISSRMFTMEETSRFAANMDDPSRMVTAYAGVAHGGDDKLNFFHVRGNAAWATQWHVNGVPVPSANHYSEMGAAGGMISIFNNHMLGNSDFHIGAWPAEFGNAIGGIFDLNLRNGNNQKHEFTAQLGTVGFDVSAEGPLYKNAQASYNFSYRYSTLSLLNRVSPGLFPENISIPTFEDLSFKLNIPTKKMGSISIWGMGGTSELTENLSLDTITLENGYQYLIVNAEESILHTRLGTLGFKHKFYLSGQNYFETDLAISLQKVRDVNRGKQNINDAFPPIGTTLHDDFYQRYNFAGIKYNHKINDYLFIRAGSNITDIDFNILGEKMDYYVDSLVEYINGKGHAALIQTFIQAKLLLFNKLKIYPSIHTSFFSLNNDHVLEPRISLEYHLAKKHSFNAGYGRHSQLQPILVYFMQNELGTDKTEYNNRALKFSKSDHYIIGYNYNITKNTHLNIEGYIQNLFDIAVYSDTSSNDYNNSFSMVNVGNYFTNVPLVNKGSGINKGIDFTLEKFFTDNWYLMFTSSLYSSTYKSIDGIERNTRQNGKYHFHFLFGKEKKVAKNNILAFNTRFSYNGGMRFTPSLEEERVNEYGNTNIWIITDFNQAYAKQLEPYIRFDLGCNYRINKPRVSHVITVDIQNLFNRQNILNANYSYNKHDYIYSYQLGLVPIIKYRLEF